MRRSLAACGPVLALLACRPPVPATSWDPPAWVPPDMGAAGTPAPPGVGDLRERVLAYHPEIQAAEALVAAAEASRTAAGAWPDPELEGRVLLDGDLAGEAALVLPVPVGGRLAAARQVADLDVALARLHLEATRQAVAVDLERALLRLARARAALVLEDALADASGEIALLAGERLRNGLILPEEAALVRAEAARDAQARVRERQEIEALEGEIRRLASLPPGAGAIPAPPLEPFRLAADPEALLATAAAARPAWIRARLEREQAGWARIQAVRERVPDPALGPAAVREGDETRLGLALSMPLPILSPGGAAVRGARAREAAATLAVEEAARQAQVEIRRLQQRLEALQEELDLLGGQVLEATLQAAALAEQRYRAGSLDVLHLLSVRRSAAGLELETLDLLLEAHETRLDLELATGRPLTVTPLAPTVDP